MPLSAASCASTMMSRMAISNTTYELLDFGDGRKLERFGAVRFESTMSSGGGCSEVTARAVGGDHRAVSRAADGRRLVDAGAEDVDAGRVVFRRGGRHGGVSVEARSALPSGQVGVFPEQRENWDWIARQVAKPQAMLGPARVLNLFAYTGGSTLAAAAAGAEVVHIDAVQKIVDRARENAAFSGLAERPIRWIAEDAVKFCRRELKRGKQYDAVILDPPSYGHGPKGEPWKIDTDLLPLLKLCGELTAENRAFVLVTCHSPGIGPAEFAAYCRKAFSAIAVSRRQRGELASTCDGREVASRRLRPLASE